MPSSVRTLGEIASHTAVLEVACNRCERGGRLRTACLVVEHGPDTPMPALLRMLAADCPRMQVGRTYDVCSVHCPQMSKLAW
jgi:hypothetical protein